MTRLADFGGVPTPWVGELIRDPVVDLVSFDGTPYPIRLDASAGRLVWSVPERVADKSAGKSSFESGLERYALTPTVEVWRFPKLEQAPVHEVVLLVDREQGTAASVELLLRSTTNGLRPDMRILRGTLAGYPNAYGGFAFPRYRPGVRQASFDVDGATSSITFDQTGQPSAVGRADVTVRSSGHVLSVAPDVWAVVWRSTGAVAIAIVDEAAGVVNGQTLAIGLNGVSTFGIRTDVIRSG